MSSRVLRPAAIFQAFCAIHINGERFRDVARKYGLNVGDLREILREARQWLSVSVTIQDDRLQYLVAGDGFSTVRQIHLSDGRLVFIIDPRQADGFRQKIKIGKKHLTIELKP